MRCCPDLNVIFLNDKYQRTASLMLERKEDMFRQFFTSSCPDHLLLQVVRLCSQCDFIEYFPGPNQGNVCALETGPRKSCSLPMCFAAGQPQNTARVEIDYNVDE